MLSDARARDGVAAFYRWWLFFERERNEVTDPMTAALRLEAPALGTYLTLDTSGSFDDLLTAPYTFVNEVSASNYGISGVSGPQMRKVPYPAGEPRIGLLTGAGLLSFYNSTVDPSWPAKRGWMITDPLLCTPVVRSFLPIKELDTSRSIRQQMIEATANESCMLCHKILNNPGFAYIGFDSSGRWRPQPGAAPNENEGWIPAEIMADTPRFNGPAELARLLAIRDETRRCFVRQWMLFSTDRSGVITRSPSTDDAPSVEVATRSFAASGFRLRALVVAIARSNVFLRP